MLEHGQGFIDLLPGLKKVTAWGTEDEEEEASVKVAICAGRKRLMNLAFFPVSVFELG